MTGTAPRNLIITSHILEGDFGQDFAPEHMGGNWWVLVSERGDGVWVLSTDQILSWYPGETWTEDGSEPEFSTEIDASQPRYIAEAVADIVNAPADQRAYVAAINGPNLIGA
jgi:hypothetical protein